MNGLLAEKIRFTAEGMFQYDLAITKHTNLCRCISIANAFEFATLSWPLSMV
jgi:hypothetical protein